MNDIKLTDEEIIKGLENWILHDCTAKQEDLINALDLIHRLQSENKELKSPKFASWKLKFFNLKEEFDKELSEHEEFTKKAKAEIERLTEYNANLNGMCLEFIDKNDELQKQVDELKELNAKYLDSIESVQAGRCRLRCVLTEQAVKETAKEIFTDLLKEFSIRKSCGNADVVVKEMAHNKGVEVE